MISFPAYDDESIISVRDDNPALAPWEAAVEWPPLEPSQDLIDLREREFATSGRKVAVALLVSSVRSGRCCQLYHAAKPSCSLYASRGTRGAVCSTFWHSLCTQPVPAAVDVSTDTMLVKERM